MKSILWLKFGLIGIVAVAGISLVVVLARQTENENRQNIDKWVDEELAEALARKLKQPGERILQTLQGSSHEDLAVAIQNIVDSVLLVFRREGKGRNVQIRLEIRYADGTSFASNFDKNWDDLPGSVREQFIRSGSEVIRCPWNFAWVNIETV